MKYLLLFLGGIVAEAKKKQSIADRRAWMKNLRNQGKFIDGSPLAPSGKTIDHDVVMQFTRDGDSVTSYAVIEAKNVDEAILLASSAPQLKADYGSAQVEIRPLQSID